MNRYLKPERVVPLTTELNAVATKLFLGDMDENPLMGIPPAAASLRAEVKASQKVCLLSPNPLPDP